ncbi:MAG: mRNA-decapping enzyme subunit 2, partial [Pleopsidium flavum]
MQLVDWLDDLCVRFIINLPQEELESVERICFQVEEAQWFYEDFIRPLDPNLPSLSLRNFCLRIFQHCPLLSQFSPYHHSTAFSEFLAYKTRVPVRGAIMLNDVMDQVVLVKGWKKGASWSFPRGKINKDEKDLDCAIREVYEETGFDIKGAGLVIKEDDMKFIEVTMREQQIRLYVFRGVYMETLFEPRTRKEISKIQWYKLSDLPTLKRLKQQHEGRGEDLAINANKFYMVAPFLGPLKKWIAQQSKHDILKGLHMDHVPPTKVTGEPVLEEVPAPENDIVQPIAGDMDRLLAYLRQSSQRQASSDHPEVSSMGKASNDASAQLKRLLSVKETQSPANSSTVQEHARNPDATRSNSLLALLRGEGTTTVSGQTQNRAPQTPLEQITTDTDSPQSPHQRHPLRPPFSSLPPSPSFGNPPRRMEQPYAQHPVGQQLQPDDSNPPALPNPSHYSSAQHTARLSQSPNLRVRVPAPTQQTFIGPPSHGPVIAPTAQRYQEVPAPYHRIGDPRSAPTPQFPNLQVPSIPPASKLPLPKLNNHSLALLDTFRNNKVKDPAIAQQTTPTTAPPNPALTPNSTGQNRISSVHELQVLHSLGDDSEAAAPIIQEIGHDLKPPPPPNPSVGSDWDTRKLTKEQFELWRDVSTNPETAAGSEVGFNTIIRSPVSEDKPRTQHQDALLNLFRKPSIPASELPKTTLPASIAPSALAELSAHTIIVPSTEETRKHNASPAQQAMNSKATTFSKHGSVDGKQAPPALQESPVSATVTGPLDMPQFEEVAKRANNAQVKDSNGTSNGTVYSHGHRASPISIMRRPASAQKVVQETTSRKRDGPIAATQRDSGHRTKRSSESVSKPFQPQILRRPAQPPQQASTIASSVAPAVRTQHRLSFDRRDSQPKEHKQALLSMFEKPASVTSHKLPASPDVVSPLHAGSSPADVFGSEAARSRIGSVSSPIGDGSVRPSSGRQTPIKANDRSFLLGYLESVAK